MVRIESTYDGGLRCTSTHTPSNNTLQTDAPVDNNGKGETFSPTDLVATALGNCMATIMGIVAQRKDISLEGMQVSVEKTMTAEAPRRIAQLAVTIKVPLPEDHPHKELLENAALTCPVHQSLHPAVDIPITWIWGA